MCGFPYAMHVNSVAILANYLDNIITATIFTRYFHLPNSNYQELGRCILENF